MEPTHDYSEAARLESLWAGTFGDSYIVRNKDAYKNRRPFWELLLAGLQCRSILEVGCNVGGNLTAIAATGHDGPLCGVDINLNALVAVKDCLPQVGAVQTSARKLPFPEDRFDLVFTMGVLIHQPDEVLGEVMDELVRCSGHWLFCGEYAAPETVEVPYRGERGALFKRDYRRIFTERYPTMRLCGEGFLDKSAGWDDVSWFLMAKSK